MRAITATMAVVGIFGILAASVPAQADEDDYEGGWRHHEQREHQWREQRWREHEWRERGWQAYHPPLAYAPPGYYPRPPAYYVPPPVYYAAPPTEYYASPPPPPVYAAPGLSIGFGFR